MEEIAGKPLNTRCLYRISIGLTYLNNTQELIREINQKNVEYALDDTKPI
jgi:hypothetical protein